MIDRSLFSLPKIGMVMGVLLVLSLAEAACVLGQAFSLAHGITNLWEGGALAAQVQLVTIFAFCFIGKQVIVYGRSTFLAKFSQKRVEELRSSLLERVFKTQVSVVSENGTAAVSASLLEGLNQVEEYIALLLPKIIGVAAIPLPILIAVFLKDWVSGIILLIFFPVIIFFMVVLGRQASAKAATQYETYNSLSNHFIDTLRGIETLKVFGQSKKFGKRIFEVSEDFRYATIDTLKVATLSSGLLDLIATLGVAGVALMLGFRLLDGSMLLYPSLYALILAPEYFKPIRDFAGDFHASLDGKNALVAITKMLGENVAAFNPIEIDVWSKDASLRFDNVSFAYGRGATDDAKAAQETDRTDATDSANSTQTAENTGHKNALNNISFKTRGFTKIGIVGVSGSGKTTLVNVLGGFANPDSGSIGVAGMHTASLQQTAWQKQLLYIPQEPYIFHASLRDNIVFYSPDATDEAVNQAVSVVGLESIVAELPNGLDTIIGEGGRGLSGGQAQRIALARALLDPTRKVLLFDEPTAHLDIETELELKERMLPLMEDKLVFFATHRLHWLDAMDHILVMEDGAIVEQGSLEELLARQGKLVELISRMNRAEVA